MLFISADPVFFKKLDLHLQTKKWWEISNENSEQSTESRPPYLPNTNFIILFSS